MSGFSHFVIILYSCITMEEVTGQRRLSDSLLDGRFVFFSLTAWEETDSSPDQPVSLQEASWRNSDCSHSTTKQSAGHEHAQLTICRVLISELDLLSCDKKCEPQAVKKMNGRGIFVMPTTYFLITFYCLSQQLQPLIKYLLQQLSN